MALPSPLEYHVITTCPSASKSVYMHSQSILNQIIPFYIYVYVYLYPVYRSIYTFIYNT